MANIDSKLNAIKSAIYGADVRTSIADGIETINTEVENTTSKQVALEDTFEDLIINAGNSNAEIVVARKGEVDLATKIGKIDSSLSDKANEIDLAIERERISSLVANAGDTDGNSELLDIRVGFDGITYPTAGDATRALSGFMTTENELWEVI